MVCCTQIHHVHFVCFHLTAHSRLITMHFYLELLNVRIERCALKTIAHDLQTFQVEKFIFNERTFFRQNNLHTNHYGRKINLLLSLSRALLVFDDYFFNNLNKMLFIAPKWVENVSFKSSRLFFFWNKLFTIDFSSVRECLNGSKIITV